MNHRFSMIQGMLLVVALILSFGSTGQVDQLLGKWTASAPTNVAESITYVFNDDQSMDIYHDGKEVMPANPLTYEVTPHQHMIELEIQYVSSNELRPFTGLNQFLYDDRMKMELFPFHYQTDHPNVFLKDVLMYRRE